MIAWYIDALDVRGGIAFASQRTSDLIQEQPDLDVPAVQLAPPNFEPEVLTSRALAFAAAPGQFQLGLFLEEAEIPFRTLDALTEFVRRAYLAGGGGDSANGIGPLPPPPPPDEGPPGIEPDGRLRDGGSVGAILGAIWQLRETSFELKDEHGAVHKLSFDTEDFYRAEDWDDDSLTLAGALLIDGLLDRLPQDVKDAPEWLDWVARLGDALASLRLSRRLRSSHYWDALAHKLEQQSRRGPWVTMSGLSRSPRQALFTLFDAQSGASERVRFFYDGDVIEERYRWSGLADDTADPMDDLERWPLPRRLASSDVVNLRDHLCVSLGAPLTLKSASPDEGAALLLFAAVHLVARNRAKRASSRRFPAQEIMMRGVSEEAMNWIRDQMPSYAFSPALEEMIGAAAAIRSHAARV